MRRLFASIALLGTASLLGGVASGATGHPGAPVQGLRAASATFQDATGEDANAPDLTTIVVSSDDAGLLTFEIAIPNRPTLTPDMMLMLAVDSDNNPATGSSDLSGADYVLEADATTGGGTSVNVLHWNGVSLGGLKVYARAMQYADGVATIKLNRTELGGTGKFNFVVVALSGIDPASGSLDNAAEDDAPDAGVYAFDTGLAPIAQPVATKLLVKQSVLVPSKPKAGKAVMFGVVLETDIGSVPSEGAVTCKATVGAKPLKPKAQTLVGGAAICRWVIPKGTKGKMFRGSLTATAGNLKATKSFAVRIR